MWNRTRKRSIIWAMAIVLDDEGCKVGLGQGQRGISRAAFPDRVKVWY